MQCRPASSMPASMNLPMPDSWRRTSISAMRSPKSAERSGRRSNHWTAGRDGGLASLVPADPCSGTPPDIARLTAAVGSPVCVSASCDRAGPRCNFDAAFAIWPNFGPTIASWCVPLSPAPSHPPRTSDPMSSKIGTLQDAPGRSEILSKSLVMRRSSVRVRPQAPLICQLIS